jgi:glycine/D-amino acid oxidase-like deaminating enzyme
MSLSKQQRHAIGRLMSETTTRSLWHATVDPNAAIYDESARTSALADVAVDVVVIGAGISGTAIAYHFAKTYANDWSVAVLDACEPGRGATGRNGGHCWPSPIEKDPAELNMIRLETFQLTKAAIEEHKIDCEFRVNGGLMLCQSESAAKEEQQWIDHLAKHPLLKDFGLEFWPAARIQALYPQLSTRHFGAVFEPNVASLHPIKLLDGLWRAIRELAGPRIQLHCRALVTSVEADGERGFRVVTSRGTVRAAKVIYATNAYTRILLPQLFHSVMPLRGQVVVTAPLPASFPEHNFSCNEREENLDYAIKRVPTNELVYGGASDYSRLAEFGLNRLEDDVLDSDVAVGLRKEVKALVGDVSFTREWTGVMAWTLDERALVGELPRAPRRSQNLKKPLPLASTGSNEFVCVGHCGDGMASCFAEARRLVGAIVTGDWSLIPAELNPQRFIGTT